MKPDASNHNPDPAYLRGLRIEAKLTQRELAELLGISRRVVQYYESEPADGKPKPKEHTAPYLYQFAIECLAAGQ